MQKNNYKALENKEKQKNIVLLILIYLFLIIAALSVLFPFYWMIVTSFKTLADYTQESVPAFIPTTLTFENYVTAWVSVSLGRYMINTVIFSLTTTAILVIVCILAAFAFARLQFYGKNIVFTVFLATMMIPMELFTITNYAEYLDKDNLSDYIIMSMACNYGDNVMKNTFLSTVNITEGHKYLVTPWDMDMSLGGNWNGGYLDEMAKLTRLTKLKLFYYLYNENIDGFKDDLARKWDELSQTVFSMENVYQCIDGYADMFTLSGAWNREYLKWNGNPVGRPLYPEWYTVPNPMRGR